MANSHDNWAQYYDFVYEQTFGPLYQTLTAETFNVIDQMIQNGLEERKGKKKQASILDVGAGTGRIAIPLIKKGHRVIAIEPSREMCKVMQGKVGPNRNLLHIENKPIQDYQPVSNTFDISVCVFTVISYILDESLLEKAIRNIAEGLKTNGSLLIDIPQPIVFRQNLNISKPEFERVVRIIQTVEDHIYNYEDTGSGRLRGQDFSYKDNFKIRYWEDQYVIKLCGQCLLCNYAELQNRGFEKTGSKYYVFQKTS